MSQVRLMAMASNLLAHDLPSSLVAARAAAYLTSTCVHLCLRLYSLVAVVASMTCQLGPWPTDKGAADGIYVRGHGRQVLVLVYLWLSCWVTKPLPPPPGGCALVKTVTVQVLMQALAGN